MNVTFSFLFKVSLQSRAPEVLFHCSLIYNLLYFFFFFLGGGDSGKSCINNRHGRQMNAFLISVNLGMLLPWFRNMDTMSLSVNIVRLVSKKQDRG